MDGQPYRVTRFAATLRRMLFREHLGLIPPQMMDKKNEQVTDYMRPAPTPNPDELGTREDEIHLRAARRVGCVADEDQPRYRVARLALQNDVQTCTRSVNHN